MKVQQAILICISMLVILIATHFSFSNDKFILLYALIALPIAIALITRPAIWFVLTVSLFHSGLKLPGLPNNLLLFHLSAFGLSFLLILQSIISKEKLRAHFSTNAAILVFLANLGIIIMVRGIGLQAFGSPLYGGSSYFVLAFIFSLLFMCPNLDLSTKLLRRSIIGMCVLALIPGLAQGLFTFSGGKLYHMYYFVEVKGFIAESFHAVQDNMGFTRFNTGALSYLSFLPLLYFRKPFRSNRLPITLLIITIALLGSALSGSRHTVLRLITFLFFWSLFQNRRINWRLGGVLALVAFLTLSIVALGAFLLPFPIQRALSFVPWANVDAVVALDASMTLDWRFMLWKRGFTEIPNYLLFGKGFAFNPGLLTGLEEVGDYSYMWAYVVGAWHSGPLSLILNTGLVGLLSAIFLFNLSIRRHTKNLLSPWQDAACERVHHVCLASYCNLIFNFFVFGGDVQSHFPQILLFLIVLEVIYQTKRHTDGIGYKAPASERRFPLRNRLAPAPRRHG